MARTMAGLYFAGATLGLASILLPHPDATNVGALGVNIALAYAGGIVGLLLVERLPFWAFHVGALAGTILITRAIYYSGEGDVSFYAVWYLWVGLFAFSFFNRSQAIAHGASVGIAYAVVQQLTDEPQPIARWLTTVGTLFIAGAFIDQLVRRVRRQVDHAAQDAASMTAVVHSMQSVYGHAGADATRDELCRTARKVTRSEFAVLWEPTGDSGLAATGHAGRIEMRDRLLFRGSRSGALQAFVSGRVVFAATVEADLVGEFEPQAGIASALWQPVVRAGETVAVLSVYWCAPVAELEGNTGNVMSLLAAQVPIAVERADLLTRLERIARTDDLTGLPNRRAWEEELPRELARATRDGQPVCVAMLDLDGFKELNDTLGHQAGDQLLKQVAATWGTVLRLTDLLVRYGGDEFAAILPNCAVEDARRLIDRLIAATPAGQSCSVGLVQWDRSASIDALVGGADAALYEAKRAGGNRVVVAAAT